MLKKLILIVFIALVIFSAIYALWDKREYTTSSAQAYQAFEAGEKLWKKLYHRDALPEFERAAKLDSNFAMAYCRLAEVHKELGQAEKAKEYIAKAESLFPLITEKEQLLIQVAKYNIAPDAAARQVYIDEYKQKFTGDIMTHRFEASACMGSRDFETAISEYEKIIAKEPSDALAYNMLGYLNYWVGNFDASLDYIKKYSLIASKEANPHDSFGEILMYLGRYDEAIKEFEAANKIKPDLDFVLSHLGDVYRDIGKFRDAIGYYERAKEFARSETYAAQAEEQIAYSLYLSGDGETGFSLIDRLHTEHPEWSSVVMYWGIIGAGTDRLDVAGKSIEELTALKAKLGDTQYDNDLKSDFDLQINAVKGKIAIVEERYQDAIEIYSQAVQGSRLPVTVTMRFLLGKSYLLAGNLDEAETQLLSNLQFNPNHSFTLNYLAKVYKEKGDSEKQKQYLLTYLSVMSGADEDLKDVVEARNELNSLTEYSEL